MTQVLINTYECATLPHMGHRVSRGQSGDVWLQNGKGRPCRYSFFCTIGRRFLVAATCACQWPMALLQGLRM